MRRFWVFEITCLVAYGGLAAVGASSNQTKPKVEQQSSLDRSYDRPSLHLPNYDSSGDLYSNSKDMVALSQYIYEHAALIEYARDKSNETLLEELSAQNGKRTLGQVLHTAHDHLKVLEKNPGADVREATKVIATDLSEKDHVDATKHSLVLAIHAEKVDVRKSCVYAITVNHDYKRIVVIFRGTSNFGDWLKDFFATMTKQNNPVKDLRGDVPQIRIHSGFTKAIIANGRMDGILEETKGYLQEFEGYRLFVAGHSLGGALATMFGFYAAASEDQEFTRNGPVTIVSVSSPRAGDANFQKSFKYLEQQGKLRHARIRNAKDKVPMVPYFNGLFRHVGLEIRLHPILAERPPGLDYPLYTKWVQRSGVSLYKQLVSTLDAVRLHGCSLVRERLLNAKDAFKMTSIEEEYRRMWGLHPQDDEE